MLGYPTLNLSHKAWIAAFPKSGRITPSLFGYIVLANRCVLGQQIRRPLLQPLERLPK